MYGITIEEEAVRRPGIKERQDVRVLQRCRRLDLHHEPLDAVPAGEGRGQFASRVQLSGV
jgi:hypothetical protein